MVGLKSNNVWSGYDPFSDYTNGGISGFPIYVDPAKYDPADGFSDSIDWDRSGQQQNDPARFNLLSYNNDAWSNFEIAGFSIYSILIFIAGAILIYKWK